MSARQFSRRKSRICKSPSVSPMYSQYYIASCFISRQPDEAVPVIKRVTDQIVLDCKVKNKKSAKASVTWFKDGTEIVHESQRE